MKRTVQRQLALLGDGLLERLGLVRKARLHQFRDSLIQEGRVFIDKKIDGKVVETLDLGPNTISYPFRVIVAKILARKYTQVSAQPGLGAVTFPLGIDGYDADDLYFPAYLYIGTDNTPATAEDTRLGYYLTTGDVPGDLPIRYPVSRVMVRDTKAEYDSVFQPINVAFEFDVPNSTLRTVVPEATPYLLREWGLSADDTGNYPIVGAPAVLGDPQIDDGAPPTQLARKVVDVLKPFEMSLTVRWEIRT